MKNIILIFCSFFFSCLSLQAQFQFRIGSPYYDEPSKVIQVQNGTLLVTGSTEGFGSSGNALLMKVNPSGTINWIKDYSGVNADMIKDMIELPDGNLILCGLTYSYGGGNADAFLMKTDPGGNMIWANTYGGSNGEIFWKVVRDGGNGFFVHGIFPAGGGAGATVLHTDSVGTVIWGKYTSNVYDWNCSDMIRASNGDIILAGGDNSSSTNFDIYRLSPSGSVIWSKEYMPSPSGSGIMNGPRLAELSSGDILINYSYSSSSTVLSTYDNCIIRLTGAGTYVSNTAYGGNYTDYSYAVRNTSDGGFIMLGSTNSAGNGSTDVSLMKINSAGAVQWTKAYGTAWDEAPSGIFQLNGGGYVFSGQTISTGYAHDSVKIYLAKTDSLGNGVCNDISWTPQVNTLGVIPGTPKPIASISLAKAPFTWSVHNRSMYSYNICGVGAGIGEEEQQKARFYPNPVTSVLSIDLPWKGPFFVSIQNILGETIYEQRFNNNDPKLDLGFLTKGIYFCTVESAEGKVFQKILKQ